MSEKSHGKKIVLETARRLTEERYLVGTGGNVSMLIEGEELLAITPSSMDYLTMKESDICIVDFNRNLVEGEQRPSVETGMHLSVYQHRPDVNAVIHTHQIYPSVFALIGESIPALFDEQVANLGEIVKWVPYGLSGSVDLLNNIAAAVDNNCNAFILQNHGAMSLGLDMEQASRNVKLLDKVAQAYYLALTTQKPISPLPPKMVETIFDLLKSEQRKEARRKKKLARGKDKEPAPNQSGGEPA
jgi:ribulose-5-phosphate 4-epimerase/fuculose-1-phosphate aldolase